MANGENLGTCDLSARFHENTPHPKIKTCVNWREQPQEPSRCPTCGSDNKKVRNRLRARGPSGGGTVNCTDPWHSEASEGREKPRSPDRHTAIDADDFIAEPATPAQGAPTEMCACGSGREPLHPAHGPAASTCSGMGAREFFDQTGKHLRWRFFEADKYRPAGMSPRKDGEWVKFEDAEAYAADQVRQATERAYDQGFTEGRRTGNIQLAEQVAQLRQERDADEQMWRERCDAASKAGYEVAMEQEREARERVEGALREIVHSVGKLAEDSGEDWRLKHAELMDAYEAGVLAVKSSEGEAK